MLTNNFKGRCTSEDIQTAIPVPIARAVTATRQATQPHTALTKQGGPYDGNFHAAMTAARATKRCKSAAAPAADESILQLHASIETIGKEAKYLEERADKIESGW